MKDFQHLVVQITSKCNFSCKICGQYRNKKVGALPENDLSHMQVERFFDSNRINVGKIYAWGGEPVLHPNFEDLCRIFKQNCDQLLVNTNGTNPDAIISLVEKNIIGLVIISLNRIQDRGNRQFDASIAHKTQKLMKSLIRISPDRVLPNLVLSKWDLSAIPNLLEELILLGIRDLRFSLPMFISKEQGEVYSRFIKERTGKTPLSWQGFDLPIDTTWAESIINNLGMIQHYEQEFSIDRYSGKLPANASFYHKYFETGYADLKNEAVECRFITDNIAIDYLGNFVLCPDFPDLVYGNIGSGESLSDILEKKNELISLFHDNGPFGVCYRCCHNQAVFTIHSETDALTEYSSSEAT